MSDEEKVSAPKNEDGSLGVTRCGFCGRYVFDGKFLEESEVEQMRDNDELENVPLGYCPEAQREHYEQNPQDYA